MKILAKNNYHLLRGPLSALPLNTLFALSVLNGDADGTVYVDDLDAPGTFYVVHPYGMSLLFGNTHQNEFNRCFRDHALNMPRVRDCHEWMQAFPQEWDTVLHDLLGDNLQKVSDASPIGANVVEIHTRVNFKFNPEKYIGFKRHFRPGMQTVRRTDKQIFLQMTGAVVPMSFWRNADHFDSGGLGFSSFIDGKLASTAFTAYRDGDKLEIGIETIEEFKGKGAAQYACSALIDYCLANGYEPIWSCRKENAGSYLLAQKLGFEPTSERPYYRLCQ
ncbi:MAG: GNAT family N-acetyltransferase [Breznakibacter sp.]